MSRRLKGILTLGAWVYGIGGVIVLVVGIILAAAGNADAGMTLELISAGMVLGAFTVLVIRQAIRDLGPHMVKSIRGAWNMARGR